MALRSITGESAVEQTRRLLKRLALQIARATRAPDSEAVHQLRVAIRRFTQSIAVYKPYFPEREVYKSRRRLKKIMTAAGEVRNCDIALKYLGKWRVPDIDHLQQKLESRRKESTHSLEAELRQWTDRQMLAKWRTTLTAVENTGPDEIPHRAISRMAEDFLELGRKAASSHASPHGLHRFRIIAKKFRYTLELFQPLYGPSATGIMACIKRASTLLGDINDCVTVADMIAEYSGGKRLLGHLKKRQHKKTDEFRQYWQAEFDDGKALENWIRPRKPVASSGLRGSRAVTRNRAAATT